MQFSLVLLISLAVMVALAILAVATIREFKRMDRNPGDFTGSDRLAGSAE
jgi:Tfp pilus assembly protein PilX